MSLPKRPTTDITTLIAIDSLFHRGVKDPWLKPLVGEFVDLIVYAEEPRFILPLREKDMDPRDAVRPEIIRIIEADEARLVGAIPYDASQSIELARDHVESAFDHFSKWARAHRSMLGGWVQLNQEEWVKSSHRARIKPRYLYSVDHINPAKLEELANELRLPTDNIKFIFDVVLRFPLYGELTGSNERYLNHPLRDAFRIASMEIVPRPSPTVPLSFRESAWYWAQSLSQENFARSLLELRDEVWKSGLRELEPGQYGVAEVRELAAKVRIPPTLKSVVKWSGVTAGLLTAAGAVPFFAVPAALGGGTVAILGAIWQGRLPPSAGRIEFMRWSMGWPELEKQAKR